MASQHRRSRLLTRSLALEEAKNAITVNVVNPSSIDEKELTLNEARRLRDARFPIGRPPTAEDVAATVAFFASEEAEYVPGQVVNVSGGWMLFEKCVAVRAAAGLEGAGRGELREP